jgi:Fe-S-cluster containining protein
MSACSHKCGGACCRSFPLNFTPAKMGELYLAAIARRKEGATDRNTRDMITIGEMLIPLAEEGDEDVLYTCRHFDDAAGLCTIYDERPQMCSDYPGYGNPEWKCQKCGFTQPPGDDAPVA